MSETGQVLKPANENPWYVLMTLYGEPSGEGDSYNWDMHRKNAKAWDAWAGQVLSKTQKREACELLPRLANDLRSWRKMRAEIEQLFSDRFISIGVKNERMPNPSDGVDFSETLFEKVMSLHDFIFPSQFDVYYSEFRASPEFSGVFLSPVSIENCVFLSGFGSNLGVFTSGFDFIENNVGGNVFLSECLFSKSFNFADSIFHDKVSVDNCEIACRALIHYTVFNELVDFEGTSFSNSGGESAVFLNTRFKGPTIFRKTKFVHSYPNFSDAVLNEKTSFSTDADFWPMESQSDFKQARDSCAIIRHNLGKQGLPEEEHFFFRREMGFAAQIGGWWQRLPYRVFGAVSDFGYSIQRPALWLFGLWLAVAMINHVVLQWAAGRHDAEYHVVQAFGLSFANQFPVFGLQARWFSAEFLSHLNPWLKALGGAQTVVALPLLFFFALGLRTRFRMR